MEPKATDDEIGKGDEEDEHNDGVDQDVRCLLVLFIRDIQTSQYKEENKKEHLEIYKRLIINVIQSVTCSMMVAVISKSRMVENCCSGPT